MLNSKRIGIIISYDLVIFFPTYSPLIFCELPVHHLLIYLIGSFLGIFIDLYEFLSLFLFFFKEN